jgi:hypothetical protein
MARNGLIVATALILASVASISSPAFAQRSRGVVGGASGGTVAANSGRVVVGSGGRFVGGGGRFVGGGRPIVTPPIVVPPRFGHRPFFPRPFFPFAVVAAAPVYYPPPVYYQPPAYYPPTYYDYPSYSAPVSFAPTPSPTVSVAQQRPQQDVVQFATGRYELRGDGVSTPYTWVWIPNPPTAPPPTAPPPAAPTAPPREAPPATGPSSSPRQPATRAGQLYRWVDAQGVVYWTDRLDAVPEQYRSRAKQTTPS